MEELDLSKMNTCDECGMNYPCGIFHYVGHMDSCPAKQTAIYDPSDEAVTENLQEIIDDSDERTANFWRWIAEQLGLKVK